MKAAGGSNAYGGSNQGGANAAVPCAPGARPAAARFSLPAISASRGRAPPATDPTEGEKAPFTIGGLEACFNNLANAAKTERLAINELSKSIAVLTADNNILVAEVRKLGNDTTALQQDINGLRRRNGETQSASGQGLTGN